MKFKSYYLIAVSALMLSSCTYGGYDDWAAPQGFDAENAKQVAFSATAADPVDLNTNAADVIKLANFSAPSNSDGSTITYKIVMGGTQTLSLDASGQVTRTDLTTAVQNLYGKSPKQRTVKSLVYAYCVDANGQSIYGRSDTINVKVSLKAPFIDSAYYLVGDMNGWATDNSAFTHSTKDVYEDPVFTIIFQTTKANCYWQIIPQNCKDSGNIWGDKVSAKGVVGVAVDGDTSMSGNLLAGAGAKAGKLTDIGWYKMTLNMMDYTYKIEAISPYLWVPGNHQDWKPANAPKLYSPDNDMTYSGYTALNGGFKFTTAPDWDHTAYGMGASEGTIDAAGGNISADAGFYYVTVDLKKLTYSLTKVNTITIIGAATGDKSWGTDLDMTYNATNGTYTYSGKLYAGGFKFRVNKGWALNFGGSFDSLTNGGANMNIDADGTYTVTLYPTYNGNSHCTVVKQ